MSSINNLTIKHIMVVLKHAMYSKQTKVPLGRWNLKYNKTSLDRSIMYSNEDHCGICSEYINIIKKKEEDNIYNDEYVCLLTSIADS